MSDRFRWTVAIGGTMMVLALYLGISVPAYRMCRADGGTFWTCAHWLIR